MLRQRSPRSNIGDYMKNLINILIIQVLFFHSIAWSSDGQVQILKKQAELNNFSNLYQSNPELFFKKTRPYVLENFKRPIDEIFFDKNVELILKEKPAIIFSFNRNSVLLKSKNKTINIKVVDPKKIKLQINKKIVQKISNMSLESFTQNIAKVLGTKSIVQKIFDSIISSAFAGIISMVLLALVAIASLSYFIGEWYLSGLLDLLDDLLKACEEIEESKDYENTHFSKLYNGFIEDFGKAEVKELSEVSCASYVSREFKNEETPYTREELQAICKKGQKVNDCHRNNKIRINKSGEDRNILTKEIRIAPAKKKKSSQVKSN